MKYLFSHNSNLTFLFYDDLTKYLTSITHQVGEQLTITPEYMDIEDICELAFTIFDNKLYDLYNDIKEYIFANYKTNSLAHLLLKRKVIYESEISYRYVRNYEGEKEVAKDANRYFMTASKSRVIMSNNYSNRISREPIEAFARETRYFQRNNELDTNYSFYIDAFGLSRKLSELVTKYLDLSDEKDYVFINSGTTSSCYRIGDYVFKLDKTKYSYEDIICPDLYIILPNLEEVFIRDDDGIVEAGIEVQKYLFRSASHVPNYVIEEYERELNRLGYYITDILIGGACGDNCRLLEDYHESGNLNPPDWFKEYPMVLVDRDRVYKLENKHPKQLRTHHSI